MTYGMTKEQLIMANAELINALATKEERIRELEAELAAECDEHEKDVGRLSELLVNTESRVAELESGETFTEAMFRRLEKSGWRLEDRGTEAD